nr:flippase-like domain-containing protein [Betaproteobacteria bacterium]
MAAASLPARSYKRWLPWIGALIGLGMLGWLLRHFDVDRFLATLAGADRRFLLLVLLAMVAEQIVRAWKWRQLLFRLRPIGVTRLFGAIMAGYLLAFLVPFGLATVARAWLVARQENLKVTAVLATVALDRLTDGIVFACLVPVALLAVA